MKPKFGIPVLAVPFYKRMYTTGGEKMFEFIIGVLVGGIIGVGVMCIMFCANKNRK